VTIAPLSWRNAKGETTFNLSVLLKDPATTTPPQTLAEEVDRSVKSLDGKLVIPVDMATEFMTQIAGLEGYSRPMPQAGRPAGERPGGDGPDVPHHHHGR
jgi:uncharacterized protein YdgA (DUF945 family)